MSYCVQCGVELDASASSCPLCEIPVYNPRQPIDPGAPTPYPQEKNTLPPINRSFAASIVSISLALPAVIFLILNLVYTPAGPWCLYPIGALLLLWVYIVPPLLTTKPYPKLFLLLDAVATALYLLMIDWLAGSYGWSTTLAIPLTALIALLVLALILGQNRFGWGRLKTLAASLMALCVLLPGIELMVDLYVRHRVSLSWSLVAIAPLAAMAVVLLLIARNRRITSELYKRLHL